MSPGSGLLFAMALAAAVAVPGPSTAATVARVLGHGLAAALPLCLGLVLGDLFWLLCTLLGAAALADRYPGVFVALRYAGVAYLLWVAWKFWRAPPMAATDGDRQPSRPLLSGLGIALANPKTMLFYLALLPGIVGLGDLSLPDALALGALTSLVVGGVLAAYALSAERLRRRLHSPAAMRRISRGSALLMAVAAATLVSR